MARFVQPQLASHLFDRATAPAPLGTPDGSRTLAALLMAAVLAALMVVADQLIDSWADGHLMLAWVLLWSVAFSALALLAKPLRAMSSRLAVRLLAVATEWRQQREEEKLWEFAKSDPRVMAELLAARSRQMAD